MDQYANQSCINKLIRVGVRGWEGLIHYNLVFELMLTSLASNGNVSVMATIVHTELSSCSLISVFNRHRFPYVKLLHDIDEEDKLIHPLWIYLSNYPTACLTN